jgi:hypothetical protein
MVVLPSPDANGSVVADLGNYEPATLKPAIPSVWALIAHDQPKAATRRAATFVKGSRDDRVAQRSGEWRAERHEAIMLPRSKVVGAISVPADTIDIVRPSLRWRRKVLV